MFCDIDTDNWAMTSKTFESAITERTAAVIPVHIYGYPSQIEAICKLAKDKNIYVIEDCAEALGSFVKSQHVGTFGDIGTFSFFGNKTLTTGEGGMCIFNDSKIWNKAKLMRDHGMSPKKRYWHEEVGFNYRLTNMQAAIGLAQLEKSENIFQRKRDIDKLYRKELSS